MASDATPTDVWNIPDDACDLTTREHDDTWIRATAGYGADIISPAGHRLHRGPVALYTNAIQRRNNAQDVSDDAALEYLWDFWTDAAEALGYLQPDAHIRLGVPADGHVAWRSFMARVDDVAADLANVVGRVQHGALSADEWHEARATLLYLRAEALCVTPRTFGAYEMEDPT